MIFFLVLSLTSCIDVNYVIDRSMTKIQSKVDDYNLTQSQNKKWLRMKKEIYNRMKFFAKSQLKLFKDVKLELQKEKPNIKAILSKLTKQANPNNSIFVDFLDYYQDFYLILNAKQKDKSYKNTKKEMVKVIERLQDRIKSSDDYIIIDMLEDYIDDYDLTDEQANQWRQLKKTIIAKRQKYLFEFKEFLQKMLKKIDKRSIKMKPILRQIKQFILKRTTPFQYSIGYLNQFYSILSTTEQKKGFYGFMVKKLNKYIDFLQG